MVLESKTGAGVEVIKCFVTETEADFKSPTTSTFGNKIANYQRSVQDLTENLDFDAESLQRLKKCVRDLHSAGNTLHQCEQELVIVLDQLAHLNTSNSLENDLEPEIGSALLKFAVIFKDLSLLTKGLVQSMHNGLLFPLENVLKTDMKDKNELRKSVDRAVKEYDYRFTKLEKDIRHQSKEAGFARSNVNAADLAEELSKERTVLQYELCKFFLVYSKISDKKGAGLLQHLIDYYHTQESYYRDGLKSIEEYRRYIENLIDRLNGLKQAEDNERQRLHQLKQMLETSNHIQEHEQRQKRSSAAPTDGSVPTTPMNKSFHDMSSDFSSELFTSSDISLSGMLWKKSNHKLHRQWQKRKCVVKNGCFYLSHSDQTREPVELNLVSCEVKTNAEDKKCFDLFCYNRTYHFQTDDEITMQRWLSALHSAKEMAQKELFSAPDQTPNTSAANGSLVYEDRSKIFEALKQVPGNTSCADCGSTTDVTWVSTNLGALVCIDCSGVHRQLGVHVSRVQSITLDRMTNAELLIPLAVGNKLLNSVYEELLPQNAKIVPNARREARTSYIRAKYVDKRYLIKLKALDFYLESAVQEFSISKLLRAIAATADLNISIDTATENTALHYIVENDFDNSFLAMVELVLLSGADPNKRNKVGNALLHSCVRFERPEHLKLALRHRSTDIARKDAHGRTALQVALEINPTSACAQMLASLERGEKLSLDDVHLKLPDPAEPVEESKQQHLPDQSFTSPSTDDESISSTSSVPRKMPHPPPKPVKPPIPPSASTKPKLTSLVQYTRSASENEPASFGVSLPNDGVRTLPGAKRVLPRLPAKPSSLAAVHSGSEQNLSTAGKRSTPPVPAPRKHKPLAPRRCRALYDCLADNQDELTFKQGELIVILSENVPGEDGRWMEGHVEGTPLRRGIFPVTFVTFEK